MQDELSGPEIAHLVEIFVHERLTAPSGRGLARPQGDSKSRGGNGRSPALVARATVAYDANYDSHFGPLADSWMVTDPPLIDTEGLPSSIFPDSACSGRSCFRMDWVI